MIVSFAASALVSLLVSVALAQSGAPTGTFINPSVPNGVESNPQSFENVQPVLGATPAPTPIPKTPKHHLKGGNVKEEKTSFVSSPDTMQKDTAPPEPKVKK